MLLREFIEKSHIEPSLVRAVVRQLGGWNEFKQSASDITRHGIDAGFGNFCYYSDTCEFARKNRKSIATLAESQASDFGIDNPIEMVKNFGCLKDYKPTSSEVGKCLYGRGDDVQVMNALAWYAAEEVARSYCDILENEV